MTESITAIIYSRCVVTPKNPSLVRLLYALIDIQPKNFLSMPPKDIGRSSAAEHLVLFLSDSLIIGWLPLSQPPKNNHHHDFFCHDFFAHIQLSKRNLFLSPSKGEARSAGPLSLGTLKTLCTTPRTLSSHGCRVRRTIGEAPRRLDPTTVSQVGAAVKRRRKIRYEKIRLVPNDTFDTISYSL